MKKNRLESYLAIFLACSMTIAALGLIPFLLFNSVVVTGIGWVGCIISLLGIFWLLILDLIGYREFYE